MSGAFHWIKTMMFCYSTENMDILKETMISLTGGDNLEEEITEGHHGNPIVILSSDITKDRDAKQLFSRLGEDMLTRILDELDERVDDDCTFYLRLDKQKAVLGEYMAGRRGDVISITAKIVSHPAKKDIAVENLRKFLTGLLS